MATTVILEAGTSGIPGDPAALYAAADEMTATAKDYFNAADAIAAHGRAVTANWVGDASDAAGRHIATLSTRVQVGSEVYTSAATAVRTYAGELAAAQDAWNTANAQAVTAATALDRAHQQATSAAAMSTTNPTGQPDPTAQAAQSLATDQAATAVTAASTALSNAQDDMAAAVANAAAANQRAADAITACCEQLTAMDGPSRSAAGTTVVDAAYFGANANAASTRHTPPKHHESAWDGAIGWAEGAGNWLDEHASDISAVAGTAAAITAFIPGVDLIATPILAGVAVGFGALATTEDIKRGDTGAAVEDGIGTALNVLPGVGMLRTVTRLDDVGRLARSAGELRAANEAADARWINQGALNKHIPGTNESRNIGSSSPKSMFFGPNSARRAVSIAVERGQPTGRSARGEERVWDAGFTIGHAPDGSPLTRVTVRKSSTKGWHGWPSR